MNIFKVLIFAALFALVFSQTTENNGIIVPPDPGFIDSFIIDDFLIASEALVIVTNAGNIPSQVERITPTVEVLGGERDLQLRVEDGATNLVLSAGVANGLYSVAAPNGASGVSLLQYDGVDGTSVRADNGLQGIDFRQLNSFAFRTVIASDLNTNIIFRILEGGNTCEATLAVPQGDSPIGYTVEYSSFSGSCPFTAVGAFEIVAPIDDNVDVEISLVSLYAVEPPSPTPTPTGTPSPSGTGTPIPVPSQTPTGTPTPTGTRTPAPSDPVTPTPTPTMTGTPTNSPSNTPSPSDTCICKCPLFTCEIFRVDDGDYVYYRGFFDVFRNAPDFFYNLIAVQ